MQTAIGIITVIQEGRFRMSLDDGRSVTFTLDAHARVEPQDLAPLLFGPRVRVRHGPAAGLRTRVAHDLCPEAGG